MKKDYKVVLTVVSEHIFHVPECNSPEEAESIAEEWFAEGESGNIDNTDIEDMTVEEYDGGADES